MGNFNGRIVEEALCKLSPPNVLWENKVWSVYLSVKWLIILDTLRLGKERTLRGPSASLLASEGLVRCALLWGGVCLPCFSDLMMEISSLLYRTNIYWKGGLRAGSFHFAVSVANIRWITTCIKVDLGICLMLRSLWSSAWLILHRHLAARFPYLSEKLLY